MKRSPEKVGGRVKVVEVQYGKSIENLQITADISGNKDRRSLLVFLCFLILVSEIVEGESFPLSVVVGKGQRNPLVFPVTKSLISESLEKEEEDNGRRGMNYSKSFPRLSNSNRVEEDARLLEGTTTTARRTDIDNLLMSSSAEGSRRKRGYFDDKEEEKKRMEETYYKSFRLFWFLAGVAIIVFILVFILALLCFCCPNLNKPKRKESTANSIPRISIPVGDEGIELPVCLDYQPSPGRMMDGDNRPRSRSPSVFSANNALYVSHHRLSQEQVNMIQLQSQTRRNSNLPSTSQGLLPASALIDVNVIQEYRGPETS